MFRIVIACLILLGGGVFAVRHIEATTRTPAAMTAAPAPVSSSPSARNVVLTKGRNGHFAVDARVDGRRLAFLVDTGASHIALRESDARRVGIYPRASDYTVKVRTANGIAKAAWAELRTVEVGDILVRNVRALVQPDEALGVNLLGMSFLSRVRWTHDRGRLVLEQ
ncbi:MAG: retropepsin-like aspartic protease family protein [Xanthobacteraceae bacterium]